MHKEWLKLSHHRHSGKLRAHEHTSYVPLLILLSFVGLALTSFTVSVYAQSPGPSAGSIGLSGQVPADPPTVAATIDSPNGQARFSTSPITISGTCPSDTLVQVYKNDIFAGSGVCSSEGLYSFEIDLLIGENILIARVYDSLNQAGPDSKAITVYYDALPAQPGGIISLDFGGAPLLLNTDAVFRGTFPEQQFQMPITILGGRAPYAVNVQWGDSTNKVISRNDNSVFTTEHIYTKAGTYQIALQATDADGRVAFLTVAAIVNGQPEAIAAIVNPDSDLVTRLLALWPLYTSLVAIVISFWLGERREKHIINKMNPGLSA